MTETIVLSLCAVAPALMILWIVRDAKRHLTGRVHRDRTRFNTVYPRR